MKGGVRGSTLHGHVIIMVFTVHTADNQLNAKPVVKQRHPGDEFPVSL